MPVYLIEVLGKEQRIVVADIVAQAIRHVSRQTMTSKTLTAEDLAKHVAAGVVIEFAEAKPDPIVPPLMGEPFEHKIACGASGAVPIGGPGCTCTSLGLE